MIDRAYEDKLYQTPKFAGAFRYNALKSCATLLCRACVDVNHLCSSTLSVNCEKAEKDTLQVTRLPFPYFAAVTCRQSAPDSLRERGDSQEGGKPQVVYPLVPLPGRQDFACFVSNKSPFQQKTFLLTACRRVLYNKTKQRNEVPAMHIHHLALRVRDFEKSLHFTRRSPSSRFTRSSPRTAAALLICRTPTAKPSWS